MRQHLQQGSLPSLHAELPTRYCSHLRAVCCALLPHRGPPPLDADEIREAVEQLLVRRAPATVLRLIGKTAYAR